MDDSRNLYQERTSFWAIRWQELPLKNFACAGLVCGPLARACLESDDDGGGGGDDAYCDDGVPALLSRDVA